MVPKVDGEFYKFVGPGNVLDQFDSTYSNIELVQLFMRDRRFYGSWLEIRLLGHISCPSLNPDLERNVYHTGRLSSTLQPGLRRAKGRRGLPQMRARWKSRP